MSVCCVCPSLGVGHCEAVSGSLPVLCDWAAVSLPGCVPGVVWGCAMVFMPRCIQVRVCLGYW